MEKREPALGAPSKGGGEGGSKGPPTPQNKIFGSPGYTAMAPSHVAMSPPYFGHLNESVFCVLQASRRFSGHFLVHRVHHL